MKKEDILKKYKSEGTDEGKDYINNLGDTYGMTGMAVLGIAITVYQGIMNLPTGDVLAMFFGFISVGMFSMYRLDKEKSKLISGLITGAICVACLAWYIWKTMT